MSCGSASSNLSTPSSTISEYVSLSHSGSDCKEDDDSSYDPCSEAPRKKRRKKMKKYKTNFKCLVCEATATGLHYGVTTCEACKVFYRRSINKYQNFKCQNGRNMCSPCSNFSFACKLCRFQKCINVGMSRTRIKIGRYSKAKHKQLKEFSQNSQKICVNIPILLNFSDADDIIVKCSNLLLHMKDFNWEDKVTNFHQTINTIDKILDDGFLPKEDFESILEVTGVEMDGRKKFSTYNARLKETILRHWLPFIKCLPGMFELDDRTFFKTISYHVDDFHLISRLANVYNFGSNGLEIKMNNRKIALTRESMISMSGTEIMNLLESFDRRLKQVNFTHEEAILVFTLNLVAPGAPGIRRDNFSKPYNRILLGFTRYLQSNYGDSYQNRLGELVNFMAYYSEQKYLLDKWREKNHHYLSYIYDTPFLRILWGGRISDIDNCIDNSIDLLSGLLGKST